ncbi:MAG: chorismate mutase [bacterium]|nr:chorismate mutase [bacterium]
MLDNLRRKIYKQDQRLLQILSGRIKLVEKIGKIKSEKKVFVEDRKREKQIYDYVSDKSKELGLDTKFVKNVFKLILAESKRLQKLQRKPK